MKRKCLLCIRSLRMVSKNDTDTETRRGRGSAYFVPVGWSEKMMRIQKDKDEEKVLTWYPQDGLKRRYGFRETKMKRRRLLCIRKMV